MEVLKKYIHIIQKEKQTFPIHKSDSCSINDWKKEI